MIPEHIKPVKMIIQSNGKIEDEAPWKKIPDIRQVRNTSYRKIINYRRLVIQMERGKESIGIYNDPQTTNKNDRERPDIQRSQDQSPSRLFRGDRLFLIERAFHRPPRQNSAFDTAGIFPDTGKNSELAQRMCVLLGIQLFGQ